MHAHICAPIARLLLYTLHYVCTYHSMMQCRGDCITYIHKLIHVSKRAQCRRPINKLGICGSWWWLGVKQLIIKATAPAQRNNTSYNACFATSAARMHDCIALISNIAHTHKPQFTQSHARNDMRSRTKSEAIDFNWSAWACVCIVVCQSELHCSIPSSEFKSSISKYYRCVIIVYTNCWEFANSSVINCRQ